MKTNENGFTLIELLVTIGIIGIIAAIAVVQYGQYRSRSFDSRAQSDLVNIIAAQEAYFSDHESYTNSISLLPGFTSTSPGVTAEVASDGPNDGWSGIAYHEDGIHTYCYDTEDASGLREAVGQGEVGDCEDTL